MIKVQYFQVGPAKAIPLIAFLALFGCSYELVSAPMRSTAFEFNDGKELELKAVIEQFVKQHSSKVTLKDGDYPFSKNFLVTFSNHYIRAEDSSSNLRRRFDFALYSELDPLANNREQLPQQAREIWGELRNYMRSIPSSTEVVERALIPD